MTWKEENSAEYSLILLVTSNNFNFYTDMDSPMLGWFFLFSLLAFVGWVYWNLHTLVIDIPLDDIFESEEEFHEACYQGMRRGIR